MRTPAGRECPFFYGDYFRGKQQEECRLLSGTSADTHWTPSLCETCPVPDITKANACEHQQLQARVVRRFLGLKREVEVSATCSKSHEKVEDPHIGCGQCHPGLPNFVIGE